MDDRKIIPSSLELRLTTHEEFLFWKQKWKNYEIVTKLKNQTDEYQIAMLQMCMDDDGLKVFNNELTTDQKKTTKDTLDALENFIKGEVNETMERHHFNSRNQKEGETFMEYLTELRQLMKSCNFCALCEDNWLRDRIVEGIINDQTRKRLLAVQTLDLKKAIQICKSEEASGKQLEILQAGREQHVDRIAVKPWATSGARENASHKGQDNRERENKEMGARPKRPFRPGSEMAMECDFCLRAHRRGRFFCPAFGKTCHTCEKPNHFVGSKFCTKKAVEEIRLEKNEEEIVHFDMIRLENDDSEIIHLDTLTRGPRKREWKTKVSCS